MPSWERTRSGDVNVVTGPGNGHWCTKKGLMGSRVGFKSVEYNVDQEVQGYTGKLYRKFGRSSAGVLDVLSSARGILYRRLFVQPSQYLVQPFCFVSKTPKYDSTALPKR